MLEQNLLSITFQKDYQSCIHLRLHFIHGCTLLSSFRIFFPNLHLTYMVKSQEYEIYKRISLHLNIYVVVLITFTAQRDQDLTENVN